MEVLEEELTCPVCCSLYEDPRVLPCAHNFCKKCLEGVLEGNSRPIWRPSFKCPTCRKEISTMGVNSPQVNYLLKGIVEKYNKMKATPKTLVCKVHDSQPLNIFCSTDLKLICGFCATNGKHKDHVFSSIDEAYKKEKSSFDFIFQSFEEIQCKDVTALLETLETNKRNTLDLLTSDSDRVNYYFKKLQGLLEQKKNEILSDFETMRLEVLQAYDPEINRLNTIINEQKRACVTAKNVKEVSDPILFLQQIEEFREKVDILKAPFPSASDVTVLSYMKNFDTHMWDNIKLGDVDKLCLPQEAPAKQQKRQPKFSFSYRAVVAVCLLLVGLSAAFLLGPPTNFLEECYYFTRQIYFYSSDIALKIKEEAAVYWERFKEHLFLLLKVLKYYTMIFLELVANFVCKYKL
ncbi:E3 ubiquitin-protein ligase TRIM13 [Hyla sarda]|uniref:E3 ubiquitin-protein ligase TRIM13 n=1 Tax=Hyla sarda TaxID=327740 RepID=UPI0024C2A193|nr:E3 ubiquitin-protein ligase TRIM13 [Hyla sarda]XP_056416338.1 E3 ubiquitin-protein ligase TRIM13 [Hyla sarda]XP_056416339.1 E3 ubiquitin-protein ligase TRIM13 [Hyla sarda]